MAISVKQVIMIVVSLFVIAAVLPLGLASVSYIGSLNITLMDGTSGLVSTFVSPTVLSLLTTLLPILVVISIALYFIPKAGE